MSTPWQDVDARILAALDAVPSRIPVVVGPDGSGRTTLLRRLAGSLGTKDCQYIDLERITSTPERFAAAIERSTPFEAPSHPDSSSGPAAAYARVLDLLTIARTGEDRAATFLLDEWLELRTFEHFPGLRHVIPDTLSRLSSSPNRFVLATRFVSRALRLLADAPDRLTVIAMPALGVSDIAADLIRLPGYRSDIAEEFAQSICALTGGRVAYVARLVEALAATPTLGDPVSALVATLSPGGPIDRRCRETYESRLHHARGYGALKAVLGVLAGEEPLTLTELAALLGRTPGSTRDYVWWLEDVDLVVAHRKQYTFADPVLRLWAGLFERPDAPTEEDVAAAVQRYAIARLTAPAPAP